MSAPGSILDIGSRKLAASYETFSSSYAVCLSLCTRGTFVFPARVPQLPPGMPAVLFEYDSNVRVRVHIVQRVTQYIAAIYALCTKPSLTGNVGDPFKSFVLHDLPRARRRSLRNFNICSLEVVCSHLVSVLSTPPSASTASRFSTCLVDSLDVCFEFGSEVEQFRY